MGDSVGGCTVASRCTQLLALECTLPLLPPFPPCLNTALLTHSPLPVRSDYMAAMPFARLKRCLEVAVLYSSQQADVNVALTTISLLWNAADMFGKAGARAAAARPASASAAAAAVAAADDESDTEVEVAVVALPAAENGEDGGSGSEDEAASPSGKARGLVAQLTAVQTEDLLQMIFLALQASQTVLKQWL